MKKKITLKYPKSAAVGFFQRDKNEFEMAVVNECRVPKCPTALNVRQILFFSKSVIMMQEIFINSKINKYSKKIISVHTQNRTLKNKCRTFRGAPKVPKCPTTINVRQGENRYKCSFNQNKKHKYYHEKLTLILYVQLIILIIIIIKFEKTY